MPPNSVLWLDEQSSMVCPELLYLQMAASFSFPALVMLGYELCGNFVRSAANPLGGHVATDVPAATSVDEIHSYISAFSHVRGLKKAEAALEHVVDHALSAPEAVLATMYSLTPEESGYGMGPVTLNEGVAVDAPDDSEGKKRFPDLLFSFAPVGINYDGEDDHLDLDGLIRAATDAALAPPEERDSALARLSEKKAAVRAKVVDDNARNRQLAAGGKIVFPVTKEDLYGWDRLDNLTGQILLCAREIFGADTGEYERMLEDTQRKRDRYDLLNALLPYGTSAKKSYGAL